MGANDGVSPSRGRAKSPSHTGEVHLTGSHWLGSPRGKTCVSSSDRSESGLGVEGNERRFSKSGPEGLMRSDGMSQRDQCRDSVAKTKGNM